MSSPLPSPPATLRTPPPHTARLSPDLLSEGKLEVAEGHTAVLVGQESGEGGRGEGGKGKNEFKARVSEQEGGRSGTDMTNVEGDFHGQDGEK